MSNTVAFLLLPQFGLLVVVPVMSKRLGLGEPVMLVLFTFMQVFSKYIFLLKKHSMRLSNPSVSVGTFSAAFAGTMLGFFASVWLTALLLCAFGPASALLTRQLRTLVFTAKNFLKLSNCRSVEEDEIGKALSGDAIIAAVVPLAAG